jgi:SAF domain
MRLTRSITLGSSRQPLTAHTTEEIISMSTLSQPLGQVLTPRKSNLAPALLLILGLIIALSAATYGYIESRRTEKVIIAVRSVPYGQQFTADDLGTIELPLHRPIQLAGIANPNQVIGTWAAREIGPNDIVQPTMLLATAPDQPVYPSGQKLDRDTVPIPFSTETIGPLTYRDVVNVGTTRSSATRSCVLPTAAR